MLENAMFSLRFSPSITEDVQKIKFFLFPFLFLLILSYVSLIIRLIEIDFRV